MKQSILTMACGLAILATDLRAQETSGKLHDGDYVFMFGDSITAVGINPRMVADYLLMCKPAQNIQVTAVASGGQTALGCSAFAGIDMRVKPTVITTLFGWNDGGYAPPLSEDKIRNHTNGLTKIIRDAKQAGVRMIIIGSPTCGDPYFGFSGDKERAVAYNGVLAGLRDVDRDLAKKEGVIFAEIHDLMLDVLTKCKKKYGEDQFCFSSKPDGGCHVADSGQLVITYAFLKAMGCDGNIGTITVDLTAGKATATGGHTILATTNGVEIESSRYPFCFFGDDPAKETSMRPVLEFLPFNQDLNRYVLIVRNIGAGKARVTWGQASKEFTADRLGQGINLAAEFLDNPFCEPFLRAESAVKNGWGSSGYILCELLHFLPLYEATLPAEKKTTDEMFQIILRECNKWHDAATAAVTPVKHVIRIEPLK